MPIVLGDDLERDLYYKAPEQINYDVVMDYVKRTLMALGELGGE